MIMVLGRRAEGRLLFKIPFYGRRPSGLLSQASMAALRPIPRPYHYKQSLLLKH